jgi:hypothetical protein
LRYSTVVSTCVVDLSSSLVFHSNRIYVPAAVGTEPPVGWTSQDKAASWPSAPAESVWIVADFKKLSFVKSVKSNSVTTGYYSPSDKSSP